MNAPVAVQSFSDSSRQPGDEPLPGYRLIQPLGKGGFGEVWKCEAPGGLPKAIKFVASDEVNHSLRQEYEAFQKIKLIRHPFLLQLERVELTERELIMVMELADSQLQERFLDCRNAGMPGIPRDELLGYFADASEALDLLSQAHGLQHLDVKPANLFLVSGRVKVGDYGLVRPETVTGSVQQRGFTPRYVAPEVLQGRVDPRSDQYSLALVYQELLTGTFAYQGKTAQHMMLLHTTAAPDLSPLPPEDRGPVAIALSKNPDDRYPSCLAFVEALMVGGPPSARHDTLKPGDTSAVKTVRLSRMHTASGYLTQNPAGNARKSGFGSGPLHPPQAVPPAFGQPGPVSTPQSPFGQALPITPRRLEMKPRPDAFSGLAFPGGSGGSGGLGISRTERSIVPEDLVELAPVAGVTRVQITDQLLKSVLPITLLTGRSLLPADVSGSWFVEQLTHAAAGATDHLGRTSAGTWVCRFRSLHPISVARNKLATFCDGMMFDELTEAGPLALRLRRFASTGLLGRLGGRKAGLDVLVAWNSQRAGEVELTARLFGEPDSKFVRGVADAMPRIFNEFRTMLLSGEERRKHARLPADFPMTIYPMRDNGEVLPSITATCRNVSLGGVACAAAEPVPTRYAFLHFGNVAALDGLAILTKMLRSQPLLQEQIVLVAGRFRKDL